MRVTNERYERDLRRMDLAMKLLELEARTSTIRAYTGLGEDRIRRLFRGYLARQHCPVVRHRGKVPQAVEPILRCPRRATYAALFVWVALTAMALEEAGAAPVGASAPLEVGEQLCEAFDVLRRLAPESDLGFEQALCVLRAVMRGEELGLARCRGCGALVLTDALALETPTCSVCTGGSCAVSA
jgi:hypothetical protein